MADDNEPNDLDTLRKLQVWAVIVILGLLIFIIIGGYIDDVFLGDKFKADPAFYTLTGGVLAGIFSAEVIRALRGRGKGDK